MLLVPKWVKIEDKISHFFIFISVSCLESFFLKFFQSLSPRSGEFIVQLKFAFFFVGALYWDRLIAVIWRRRDPKINFVIFVIFGSWSSYFAVTLSIDSPLVNRSSRETLIWSQYCGCRKAPQQVKIWLPRYTHYYTVPFILA